MASTIIYQLTKHSQFIFGQEMSLITTGITEAVIIPRVIDRDIGLGEYFIVSEWLFFRQLICRVKVPAHRSIIEALELHLLSNICLLQDIRNTRTFIFNWLKIHEITITDVNNK